MYTMPQEYYTAKYKVISLEEFDSGTYDDLSLYRYYIASSGYRNEDGKTGITTSAYTLYSLYDRKLMKQHEFNLHRRLDKFFTMIDKK